MEKTLVLLKPDAVARGLIGRILGRFEDKGLRIVGLKMLDVPAEMAERHYSVHKGRDFYAGLIRFITSGPVVAACIEGKNAIKAVRSMVGATNSTEAQPGSIRGDMANSNRYNLVHASDGQESARKELGVFFRDDELCCVAAHELRWVYDLSEGLPL